MRQHRLLAACVLCASGGLAAVRVEARPIQVGERLRDFLPSGDAAGVSVVRFDLFAAAPVELVIEAHSLEFDTRLTVLRTLADGTLQSVGEDDDGGPGTDSRL